HFAPEGASVVLLDAETGAVADPILVDRNTGRAITEADHVLAAGPAAPEPTRRRYAAVAGAATATAPPPNGGRRAAQTRGPPWEATRSSSAGSPRGAPAAVLLRPSPRLGLLRQRRTTRARARCCTAPSSPRCCAWLRPMWWSCWRKPQPA